MADPWEKPPTTVLWAGRSIECCRTRDWIAAQEELRPGMSSDAASVSFSREDRSNLRSGDEDRWNVQCELGATDGLSGHAVGREG